MLKWLKKKKKKANPGMITIVYQDPQGGTEVIRFHDDIDLWWEYYCSAYLEYGVEWIHIKDQEDPGASVSIQGHRILEVRRTPDDLPQLQ